MRKKFVAGNWKMHKTVTEAQDLVKGLLPGLTALKMVDRVLCPPFTDLWAVKEIIDGSDIGLGAQNMYWESSGAYTGEISPPMLAEICQYVVLGHSERRQYFGETDETVNKKIRAAFSHGLTPIICIGESLEQNEAGMTSAVVNQQVRAGLGGLSQEQGEKLVIAYEPIWAIGTGLAATPEDANAIHKNVVRKALMEMFGEQSAENIRILYGGSVKPGNAKDFFSQSDIDGALVGGASLKADSFVAITQAAV